jgi:hypothetical protein
MTTDERRRLPLVTAFFTGMLPGVCVLSFWGCMTFNGKGVPRVDVVPPPHPPLLVMTIGSFAQMLNGEGTSRGVLDNTTIARQMAKGILANWKSKGLISDFGVPGDLRTTPDYTFTISGTRNEESSIIGAVFTGLTLYLIPSSSTIIYDLSLELRNNHSDAVYSVHAVDSVSTWLHLVFLPAFPIFWVGSYNMISDLAEYVYSEFEKQGAFSSVSPEGAAFLPRKQSIVKQHADPIVHPRAAVTPPALVMECSRPHLAGFLARAGQE